MADIHIHDIDEQIVERIKALARKKGWPLNDVILHLLKQSLGIIEPEPAAVPGDIARLTGAWGDAEVKAFEAALSALDGLPDDAPSYEKGLNK